VTIAWSMSPHVPGLRDLNLCISYPKSGRTWLRVMLADLGVACDYTHLDTGADKPSWGRHYRELRPPAAPEDARVLFLHRDPRDTVVSFFHEMTKRNRLAAGRALQFLVQGRIPPRTLGAFVRSPRYGIEKTIRFNLACAAGLPGLHVGYEALRSDPAEQLLRIVRHFGSDAPIERVRSVVLANSFEKMRAKEASGAYGTYMLRPRDPADPDSYKVRRGKIGGWRDEMDRETQAFANAMLERYDYFEAMRAARHPAAGEAGLDSSVLRRA
jgi:hypothetical protein